MITKREIVKRINQYLKENENYIKDIIESDVTSDVYSIELEDRFYDNYYPNHVSFTYNFKLKKITDIRVHINNYSVWFSDEKDLKYFNQNTKSSLKPYQDFYNKMDKGYKLVNVDKVILQTKDEYDNEWENDKYFESKKQATNYLKSLPKKYQTEYRIIHIITKTEN